jgi:hypothetical protein
MEVEMFNAQSNGIYSPYLSQAPTPPSYATALQSAAAPSFGNIPYPNAPYSNAPYSNAPYPNAPYASSPHVNTPFSNDLSGGQSANPWAQQSIPPQVNPVQQRQALQQLAQYHYLVAQQLAQLAAQQALPGLVGNTFPGHFNPGQFNPGQFMPVQFIPGQFIPGQVGPNFVPGMTLH